MSTRALQQVLALIYTDTRARSAFLNGDESYFVQYELTARDLNHLCQLRKSRERVEFFCDLLANKQEKLIRSLLPLTHRVLGEPVWVQAWSNYLSTTVGEAMIAPSAKAISFLDFVEDYVGERSLENPPVKNVLSYERCKLAIRSQLPTARAHQFIALSSQHELDDLYPLVRKSFLVRQFSYDLQEIISGSNDWTNFATAKRAPTLILFYRNHQTGGVNTAKVGPWMEQLLSTCDGQTRAMRIVAWLAKNLGDPSEGSLAACEQFLRRLERDGLIGFLAEARSDSIGGRR